MSISLPALADAYENQGFISAVPIVTADQAALHRQRLEAAEEELGELHYQAKIHTILRSAFELASHKTALDIVETLIGGNILVHNVTYIIKEPGSAQHVSWHQDLTYWGFNDTAQVSMWLALSPASEHSGCMLMLPGSHKRGIIEHEVTADANNVLLQGQTIRDVDESQAVSCPLLPGEASFHHGWTLHSSSPNSSDDRRIGLNVQYIAPHMKQTKSARDTALLLRGDDRFQHFGADKPASEEIDHKALHTHRRLNEQYVSTAGRS